MLMALFLFILGCQRANLLQEFKIGYKTMKTACSINQVSTNVQLNNDTINFVTKTTDLKMRKIADVFCN